MSPGALAGAERVKPPSMTRVIAALADSGMVSRQPHPTDGRQAVITLTPAGREVILDELAARKEWLSDRLAELSSADRSTLSAAIPILIAMINAEDLD